MVGHRSGRSPRVETSSRATGKERGKPPGTYLSSTVTIKYTEKKGLLVQLSPNVRVLLGLSPTLLGCDADFDVGQFLVDDLFIGNRGR